MIKKLLQLKADRRGVTALEYALIAGVVVATVVVGFTTLGNDISNAFTHIGTSITTNAGG